MTNWKPFDISFIQQQIFEDLAQRFPNKKAFIAELKRILGLKESAIYKKLRGDSQFTLKDMLMLSMHLSFSMDQYFAKKASPVPFQVDAIRRQPASYEEYLQNINLHFRDLKAAENVTMYYVACEMPLFHYLQFPFLFYFKLFVWNETSWRSRQKSREFGFREFKQNKKLEKLRLSMLNDYYTQDGVENWNIRFIDMSLDQLKFYVNAGRFKNEEDIWLVFKDIEKLSAHLKRMAEKGHKFVLNAPDKLMGKLRVQMNELVSSTNVIYVSTDEYDIVFSSFDTPNFIKSTDQRFCNYSKEWIDNVIEYSVDIGGVGKRERDRHFRIIGKKLETVKEELRGMVSYLY